MPGCLLLKGKSLFSARARGRAGAESGGGGAAMLLQSSVKTPFGGVEHPCQTKVDNLNIARYTAF